MKWIAMLVTLAALCCCALGCANRFQHAADRSMLIQENLQLDQALNLVSYELMLAQQENDALRRQIERVSQNAGGTTGGVSTGRTPPLRSQHEQITPPTFEANNPNLPPPSHQLPHHFQRPQQPQLYDPSQHSPSQQPSPQQPPPLSQPSPPQTTVGVPQWSPHRIR
jgi:hypothetical protein